MRYFFTFCFVVFFAFSAQADDFFTISTTPWGSSRKEVSKTIGVALPFTVTKSSGLTVTGYEMAGYDGNMGYVFYDDKLIEIHFRITSEENTSFSIGAAGKLNSRLQQKLTKSYGEPYIDNAVCEKERNCTYSLWNKSSQTIVGLFYTENQTSRNLGVSYMQREASNPENPFWEPHKGLVLIPE